MARPTLPESFLNRLGDLPDQPGVYLFKDAQGHVLYIGKALSVRKRVGSYFHAAAALPPRIVHWLQLVRDVEVRTVGSEAEALLLESGLIKELKPRYNVAYRDDKSYPRLKLTNEPFPRLVVTRERGSDLPAPPPAQTGAGRAGRLRQAGGSRYFGPYADAGLLRQALQFMRRVFPLRTCRTFPKAPCLEYHLGQCLAPCVGYIDERGYQRIVDDLIAFLEGKRDDLLRDLSERMKAAARAQRFEEAARVRDQIQALTSVIVAKEKSAFAGPLEQLQLAFKLPVPPRRIEAFDISNIYGAFAVGSMVAFKDGKPFKSHYRRFKIETVQGIDDTRMMREVIHRRYGGSLAQELPTPDLILVDGGKGQLGAALDELKALGRSIPSLGLAKRFEHIVVPGRRDPVVLLPTSPVLHLVQRIRDEAHRFAITYHRRLRARSIRASVLNDMPGIGPKRKAALLAHFGSLERLRGAQAEEVADVARISEPQAARLLQHIQA